MKSKIFHPASVLFTLLCLLYASCTKSDADRQEAIEEFVSAIAAFSSHVIADDGRTIIESQTVYRDSSFYFQNRSDSGTIFNYDWDFGDGTKSSEKNPVHKYGNTGAYRVILTVKTGDKTVDTVQKVLKVVLGEKYIAYPNGLHLDPIEIIETKPGSYSLLAVSDNSLNYHLYTLDSLFTVIEKKDLGPLSLTSIALTSDGNLIAVGSNRNSQDDKLFKLRPDGTIIWSASNSGGYYNSISVSADGGFIAIGFRMSETSSTGFGNTFVTKFDADGNQEWERYLNREHLDDTKNAVIVPDGIIVAGASNGKCEGCDSISLVKLALNGETLWQSKVEAGFNTLRRRNQVTKLIDGNLVVTNVNGNTVFVFSPTGTLLRRQEVPYNPQGVISDNDGGLIVLQGEVSTDYKVFVSKFNPDGSMSWNITPNRYMKGREGNLSCCSKSTPVAITRFSNGQLLFIGTRVSEALDVQKRHIVTLLFPLSEGGKPY